MKNISISTDSCGSSASIRIVLVTISFIFVSLAQKKCSDVGMSDVARRIITAPALATLAAKRENNGIFEDLSHKNYSFYRKTTLIFRFSMLEIGYTVILVKFGDK